MFTNFFDGTVRGGKYSVENLCRKLSVRLGGDQLTGGVELTVRDEYSAICLRKIDRQRHIFAIKMRRGTGKLCNVQSIQ